MYVLGTLNAIPFDKPIYIYLKVQKLSGDFWNIKSEVWNSSLNGCQKTHMRNSNQSVKNNPTKFEMAATKI